jgi:Domain of unknown function (DUF4123)
MNVAAAPPSSALSTAQLVSGLWSDARLKVYALILGARVPDLGERLAQARGVDYHCLVPGALGPAQRVRAPYIVELQSTSPFALWLLLEAAAGFGEWGVVARSSARLLDARSHARGLRQVISPEQHAFHLDWMDPPVLDILLTSATPDQLPEIFGRFETLTVAAPQRWREYRIEAGRLQLRSVDVLKAA